MRWLHMSDMHHVITSYEGDVRLQEEVLTKYLCEHNILADELFITGDFRYAKTQKDLSNHELARALSKSIWKIANCIGIYEEQHIHIVPGNHDLTRTTDDPRYYSLPQITRDYNSKMKDANINDAVLPDNILDCLFSAFDFFREVVKAVFSQERADTIITNMRKHLHFCDSPDDADVEVICLNTAITSNLDSSKERGTLILDHSRVAALLEVEKRKPKIVLGHHPLEYLESNERQQLEHYFYNYYAMVYLSGHNHVCTCSSIDGTLLVAGAGCSRKEKNSDNVILVGEFSPKTKSFKVIKAHRWENGNWSEFHGFYRGNGNTVKYQHCVNSKKHSDKVLSSASSALRIPLSRIESDYSIPDLENSRKQLVQFLLLAKKNKAVKFLTSGLSKNDNLDGIINPALFYDLFYIDQEFEKAENLNELLSALLSDDSHNTLLLRGDAGTGKSTFIRTMAIKASKSSQRDSRYYRYVFFDCAEQALSGELQGGFFPRAGLLKYLKNEYANMQLAAVNGGAEWRMAYLELLKSIMDNQEFFIEGELAQAPQIANRIFELLKKDEYRSSFHTQEIYSESFGVAINMLHLLLLLISKNCLFNKEQKRKYVIVYDNVEAYTNNEQMSVGRNFSAVNKTLNEFFRIVSQNSILPKRFEALDYMRDFTFVICSRPTTLLDPSLMNSLHACDSMLGERNEYVYLREFYDFTIEAVLLKLKFLYDNSIDGEILSECARIVKILIPYDVIDRYINGKGLVDDSDLKQYFAEKYLPFFNNNYRNAISNLDTLYKRELEMKRTWMDAVQEMSLKNRTSIDKIKTNAARHIILRNSIDTFISDGYFQQIGIGKINGEKSYSLTRVLLAYIDHCSNGRKSDNPPKGVLLSELVLFFEPIYDRSEVLKTIYGLSKWTQAYRKSSDNESDSKIRAKMISSWAYFIEISGSRDDFINYSGSRIANECNITLCLTPAGRCFANYISLQFEYFAARIINTPGKPLFLCDNISEYEHSDGIITIRRVFDALSNFADGLSDVSSLASLPRPKSNLHRELRASELMAVVTETIEYIDRYRRYIWNKHTDAAFNQLLLNETRQFISLINKSRNIGAQEYMLIQKEYFKLRIPTDEQKLEDLFLKIIESEPTNRLVDMIKDSI